MAEDDQATVLVVDDTESNIDIVVEALGEHYEVSVALDGESALEIVEDEVPDLILLDIMMPDMDGYEVCRRLKAAEKTRSIPVVFLSAITGDEERQKGIDLGAVEYLTKPIDPKALQDTVSRILSK